MYNPIHWSIQRHHASLEHDLRHLEVVYHIEPRVSGTENLQIAPVVVLQQLLDVTEREAMIGRDVDVHGLNEETATLGILLDKRPIWKIGGEMHCPLDFPLPIVDSASRG